MSKKFILKILTVFIFLFVLFSPSAHACLPSIKTVVLCVENECGSGFRTANGCTDEDRYALYELNKEAIDRDLGNMRGDSSTYLHGVYEAYTFDDFKQLSTVATLDEFENIRSEKQEQLNQESFMQIKIQQEVLIRVVIVLIALLVFISITLLISIQNKKQGFKFFVPAFFLQSIGVFSKLFLMLISNILIVDMDIVWWAFMIGVVSHLVADSFTHTGVPWLFPIPTKFGVPPLRALRFHTGSFIEKGIVFPGLLLVNMWIFYTYHRQIIDFLRTNIK